MILTAALGLSASAAAAPLSPGERAYQKCFSCHAIERGKQLEGPSLNGIVGRPVAAARGFDYSPAMRAFAKKRARWTAGLLDRYIADPEALVPKTRMNYPGMRNPRERSALLDYLKRLRP